MRRRGDEAGQIRHRLAWGAITSRALHDGRIDPAKALARIARAVSEAAI
ncbi:hypothetical protein [Bosea sp. F3-2]|nr:hypothetical protein [Bosea sp. F3-2]